MLRLLLLPALLVATLAPTAVAGEYNPVLNIGDAAPAFTDLPGVDGRKHSLADWKQNRVLAIVFTCNSCPYAVDYEDRLIEFAKKHAAADDPVALIAINVNKVEEDALPAMIARAEKLKFPFAYFYDETQQIARDFGATRTPEFFVLDADRKIVYMGAMDDDPAAKNISHRYLEEAVQAVLAEKQPATRETVPIGCAVRFERQRRGR